jgi:hypothetical protein
LAMPRRRFCGSSAAISSALLSHRHRLRAERRRCPLSNEPVAYVSSQNLEIQFEKPTPGLFTSHPRSQGKAHQCDPDAPGLCTQIWKLKQKPTARVGVVKSLEFSIADRAGTSRDLAEMAAEFGNFF